MNASRFLVLALAASLILAAPPYVGAAPIHWDYSAGLNGGQGEVLTASAPDLSAGVAFNWAGGQNPLLFGAGSGTVPLFNLLAEEGADRFGEGTNASFAPPTNQYSFILDITDSASHAFGTLTFSGELSGTVGPAPYTHVTNAFLGSTTQSLVLGGNRYSVTVGPFQSPTDTFVLNNAIQPPPQPTLADFGSLSATVDVAPVSGGGEPHSSPEPSALVLASLGLCSLGVAAWRRRRAFASSPG